MNKKIIFAFASLFLLFNTSLSWAHYANGTGKPSGITTISHPIGFGSTYNQAQFNRYTDNRVLVALRGHGFYETELPGANHCAVSPPASLNIPAEFPLTAVSYPAGVTNTTPGFPYFDRTCMQNYLGTSGPNGGIASHLDERDFLTVRVCPNGNCGSEPVLSGSVDPLNTTSCTTGNTYGSMLGWGKSYGYWYPGTQSICTKNFNSIPEYEHAVSGLDLGDRVRFFVYIHNSAQEFDAGSTQHQQTAIYSTNVNFDWSNPQTIAATIAGNNHNGGTVSITDSATLTYAQTGLTLEPVTGSVIRRGSGASGGFTYTNGSENLLIPMGVVASSYGNMQLAYIDFDVVQAPQAAFTITKTATQNGLPLNDGDIANPDFPIRYTITVTNNGAGTSQGPILTDVLPVDVLYAGGAMGNVSVSGQTVTLDFSGTTFTPGTSQAFSFNTEFNPGVSINGVPFCNEVFLDGVSQDSLCLEFGAPSFSVTKSVNITSRPPTAVPGQTLTYTFTVTNTGNVPNLLGAGPSFADPLDPNLDSSTFATTDSALSYVSASNIVLGNLAQTVIQPGQSVTLSYNIDILDTVSDGTIICNPEPFNPANGISNQVCITIEAPNFLVTKAAFNLTTNQALSNGDTINSTDIIRYDITVTNQDTTAAVGPMVVDDLDPAVLYVSDTSTFVFYNAADHRVFLNFAGTSIAPGASQTLSFTAQLDQNNTNVVDGFIFCNPFNLATSLFDNDICLTTNLVPVFTVVKSATDDQGQALVTGEAVQTGDNITFQFAVQNTSNTSGFGPIFTDQLDPQFDWTSFSTTHAGITLDQTSGVVTFDLSNVSFIPLSTQTYAFSIDIMSNAVAGSDICNPAAPFNPSLSIISNQICFVVVDISGLTIHKEARYPAGHVNEGQRITPPAMLNPGDEFVYHIEVTNTGTNRINSVTVLDDLPDDVLHIQNLTNNLSPIPNPNIDPVAGTILLANFNLIEPVGTPGDTAVAEILVRIAGTPNETRICNQATVTQINGQATSSLIMTGPDDACVSVNITGGGTPNVRLEKTVEDANGQSVVPQPGEYFYYQVTATNTGDGMSDPFTVTDVLPANIIWSPDVTGVDPALSFDATTGAVSIAFGALEALTGSETYRFRVQLAASAPQQEYCNQVTTTVSGIASAQVCFNNTTNYSGGGGGGAVSNQTVGVCFQHPTGAWGCEKRYPDWNPDDPDYTAYADCVADTHDRDACLYDWVQAKGFYTCTPDDNTIPANPLLRGINFDERVRMECEERVIVTKPCDPEADIQISVEKQIMHKDIVTDQNYTFIESQSKSIYNTDLESAYKNICKEKIYYRVNVNLQASGDWITMYQNGDLNLTNATLRVYDVVIPSEFGWLGDRGDAIEDFEDDGWTWNKKDNYFYRTLTQAEILSILDGQTKTYTVNYSVQSDLIAGIDQDKSVVTNTAFAVLDFTGSQTVAGDGQTATQNQVIGGRFIDDALFGVPNRASTSVAGQCDIVLDDIGSLGDEASTQVRIFRPFAQTRGGADYGGQTLTQTNPTETNKYTSGAQFAEKLAEINTFMADAKENFYQFLAGTATVAQARLGIFNSTPKNDGLYYLDLAAINRAHYTLPPNFVLNRSETFVIENGDLFIGADFVPKGVGQGQNTSSQYFSAFIVRNGNIVIAPEVKEFEGLFMVENGEFISGIIANNGRVTQQNSYNQLNVSGNIMGDATDLIYRRRYIGEFNADGVFTENGSTQTLQPNVRVTYDTRILEQTPPGLQNFLGGSWQQQVGN